MARGVEGVVYVTENTPSCQGSVFLCFETTEASKEFLERDDIKSFKENELLVLSRLVIVLPDH